MITQEEMDKVTSLLKEVEHYKKILGIAEYDPATNGYLVLIEQLRQRNEYLKDFKIKDKIATAVKDDPVYARAMDLIDTLPKMVSSVNNLKLELKIEFNPEEGKVRKGATTPQSLVKQN
jgi:hypothetical protein